MLQLSKIHEMFSFVTASNVDKTKIEISEDSVHKSLKELCCIRSKETCRNFHRPNVVITAVLGMSSDGQGSDDSHIPSIS